MNFETRDVIYFALSAPLVIYGGLSLLLCNVLGGAMCAQVNEGNAEGMATMALGALAFLLWFVGSIWNFRRIRYVLNNYQSFTSVLLVFYGVCLVIPVAFIISDFF